MESFIRRLPQEVEDKIREYALSDSDKIRLLANKYANDLCDGLTLKQIDAIYKNACIYKIHPTICLDYRCDLPLHLLSKLFKTSSESLRFMCELVPPKQIIHYWKHGNTCRPSCVYVNTGPERSIDMYVDNIVSFGKFLRRFPHKNKNDRLRDYCDKVVYQMIMCILILKKKNKTRSL